MEEFAMALYRHGDLLVSTAKTLPVGARRLQHVVLAQGELTGHSHRIAERESAILYETTDGLYLDVTGDAATLIHQEHGPIELPRGLYHVWRQREYSPAEIRTVRD
jgi:hypothetical protein